MKPIERIVVAVDLKNFSEEVLKASLAISEELHAKLSFIHVIRDALFEGSLLLPPKPDFIREVEKEAQSNLEGLIAHSTSSQAVASQTSIKIGSPDIEILRFARQQKAQLLIAGTRSLSGLQRFLLGSTAETLIRKSECPVWIVKTSFDSPRKILILTDLSEASRAGFRLGIFFAKLFKASVKLVYVFSPIETPSYFRISSYEQEIKRGENEKEEFKNWAQEIANSKLEVIPEWLEGKFQEEIDKLFSQEKFDLAVLSTHGKSGLFHKPLGSKAAHFVRHAPCSLLIARPDNFRLKEI